MFEALRGLCPDEAVHLESVYKQEELPQMASRKCTDIRQGALEALAQSPEAQRMFDALKVAGLDHPFSKLSHAEFSERFLETL